jgi:hypothetical protein
MQVPQQKPRSLLFWLALGLTVFSTQACSGDAGGKIKLPAGTEMVLTVDKEGKVTLLDAKGATVPKCQFCTPELEKKHGAQCKDAPSTAGICPGLSGVAVQEVSNVTFVSTHKNPCYKCGVIRGVPYCVEVTCPTQ